MSERERWIVYPLLFFALGAALRDKFTQQVKTDRLMAGEITCEELRIVDSQKPDRIVARLSSGAPQPQAGQQPDRFGLLVLIDSEGKELCGVTNNQLVVNQITCQTVVGQAIKVVDPLNQQRALAVLSSAVATEQSGHSRRVGSLVLANSEGQELFGLANDRLQMRHIICEGIAATDAVAIVDPGNPSRTLAALTSVEIQGRRGKPQRQGALLLNNRTLASDATIPLTAPKAEAPPAKEAEADEEKPAAKETDGDESPSDEGADAT